MSESENKCVKCGGFGTYKAVFGLPNVRCTDCAGTGLADPAAEIARLRKDAATLAREVEAWRDGACHGRATTTDQALSASRHTTDASGALTRYKEAT